ncbi:MAG: elongation factor G [Bacteroidia bacterium]|nr:elongation factor G [Bacteroidia bacterium]MCF8427326.1 elongation factor G [Bacteroidia bacterium]MCF8446239.1 elongation factor G [Bacteroidia bacterium]
MATYDTAHVKNIVLLGHAGSGKTTFAECAVYEAGLINRRGTVEEKSTLSDYHELEQERGNSIFATLLHTTWKGYKINIIDTPGSDDFAGEIISALRVADTSVVVLNSSHGVEVGTELVWEYTEEFKTPTLLVVNQIDHEKSDFDLTVEQAKNRFGSSVVVVQYPLQQGAEFNAIVDVLNMIMYQFPAGGGKPEKLPIPESEMEKAESLHKELIEAIASNDEGLMEKYFEKGNLEEDEMRIGLKKSLINHDLFPLFCVSSKKDMGIGRVLGFIDNVCPSAAEMPVQITAAGEELPCVASGPACIFVFKTVNEQHLGEMSLFKVYSGTITTGMELVNENNGTSEKINQLFLLEGKKRIAVDELVAGDIGATIKLKNTHTNNSLHVKGKNYALKPIVFPESHLQMAIESLNKGEEEKLAQAIHQLCEEDPSISLKVSQELRQTILSCRGDLHLSVVKWKLSHIYKLEVGFTHPRIPYRETIQKQVNSMYRHKKQSGGAGQFGEVHMLVEPFYEGMPDPQGVSVRGKEEHPLPWGGKLVFYNCIVGGAIDTRFLPSIMKGIMEKMHIGPLTGSYVRDVRVSVYDGKMHAVDSNDISFKIAGMMAFKDAFHNADPQILEPVYTVEVLCPDEVTGSVMSDLQSRRAMIEGMDISGHYQKITAKVPLSEMQDYQSTLKSLTQGKAKYNMQFDTYHAVSYDIQKKLIEEYQKHAKDEMN